ncbi:MAG: transposase, partial [Cyanobacteria bacterium P01_D01_bin.36]
QLQPGDCVVMDNARIHRQGELLAMLSRAQASLVFLPPYSPEFSPIENAWSKLKNSLRSWGARTLAQLQVGLEKATEQIALKDIFN